MSESDLSIRSLCTETECSIAVAPERARGVNQAARIEGIVPVDGLQLPGYVTLEIGLACR